MKFISDLIELIFPNLCDICSRPLVKHEQVLCLTCLADMPLANIEVNNEVEKIFAGRINFENACTLYKFEKGSMYRTLIHKLKYQNRPDIGKRLGKELAHHMVKSDLYTGIDLILPVPLHKSRQRKRGYNQSECIAGGISEVLKADVHINNLIRKQKTSSQTIKNRAERNINVENAFDIHNPDFIKNKHILIIDDVITTGATIEACVKQMEQYNCKVSIAALAYATI